MIYNACKCHATKTCWVMPPSPELKHAHSAHTHEYISTYVK